MPKVAKKRCVPLFQKFCLSKGLANKQKIEKTIYIPKINKPNDNCLPKVVCTKSVEQQIHNMPINKTINATKKVCTYISCLLIKLSDDNSCFQLKYFGKIRCTTDRSTKIKPIILRCNSIFFEDKGTNKRGCFIG